MANEALAAFMDQFLEEAKKGFDDLSKGDLGRFKALGGLESVGTALKAERVDEVIITGYERTS